MAMEKSMHHDRPAFFIPFLYLMILFHVFALSASVQITLPFETRGFIESGYGSRYRDDPYEKDNALSELRLQLDLSKNAEVYSFTFKSDFYYDDVVTTRK